MKKFKGLLSFLLSIIIVFSSFPISASAQSLTLNKIDNLIAIMANGDSIVKSNVNMPYTVSGNIDIIELRLAHTVSMSEGEKISLRFKTDVSYLIDNGTITCTFSKGASHFSFTPKFSNGYLYVDFTSQNNYTDYIVSFTFDCYDDRIVPLNYYFQACSYQTTSAEQGFWDNVLQWLKDIRDNLVNGFSNLVNNISSFFTNLTNNIRSWFDNLINSMSTFFTNLSNNLKTWFENVGAWFSDLAKSIGDYFANIWENITITIDGIQQSIKDWWQSVCDFFRSLFVPEDGFFEQYREDWKKWFKEHFGFIYDIFVLFGTIIDNIISIKSNKNPVINVPEIVLPFGNYVLLESTSFSMSVLLKNDVFSLVYEFYLVFATCIFYILLLKFGYKSFVEVLEE